MSIISETSRLTSSEVYNQIKEEGLLNALLWQVYDCLYRHGPLTAREAWSKLWDSGERRLAHSIIPRFAQLKKMGLVRPIGKRLCSITNRKVLVWDVTDKYPVKVQCDYKPSKEEQIRILQEHLRQCREECDRLRSLLRND